MENENITTKQSLTLTERKTLSLDNVKKIDSFDANEFLLDTSDGYVQTEALADGHFLAAFCTILHKSRVQY